MTTVILPEDVVKLEVEIKRLTIENQQLRETLRDKFAMAALSGICSHPSGPQRASHESIRGANARWAFEVADAMLAARK